MFRSFVRVSKQGSTFEGSIFSTKTTDGNESNAYRFMYICGTLFPKYIIN